jgi:hypothetical protein
MLSGFKHVMAIHPSEFRQANAPATKWSVCSGHHTVACDNAGLGSKPSTSSKLQAQDGSRASMNMKQARLMAVCWLMMNKTLAVEPWDQFTHRYQRCSKACINTPVYCHDAG